MDSIQLRKIQQSHECSRKDWFFTNPISQAACAFCYFFTRLSGQNLFDGFSTFEHKWLVRKAVVTTLLEEHIAFTIATSMTWGLQ